MSEYVRKKEILYPIDDDLLEKLGVKEAWDIEEINTNLFTYSKPLHFRVEYMSNINYKGRYYLGYLLSYKYDVSSDEFGRSRSC